LVSFLLFGCLFWRSLMKQMQLKDIQGYVMLEKATCIRRQLLSESSVLKTLSKLSGLLVANLRSILTRTTLQLMLQGFFNSNRERGFGFVKKQALIVV